MLYFEMYTWKSSNLWHNKLTGNTRKKGIKHKEGT